LNVGWPADLTWYKLLTDWGSVIGGIFALLAAAALYKIGRAQAKATREGADILANETRKAAEQQVATANAELEHLKAEKAEADQRAQIEVMFALNAEAARIEFLARLKHDTARRRHTVATNLIVIQPNAYTISSAGLLREGRGFAILRHREIQDVVRLIIGLISNIDLLNATIETRGVLLSELQGSELLKALQEIADQAKELQRALTARSGAVPD
jgi:type II secretory pathway pseudopilin PulG